MKNIAAIKSNLNLWKMPVKRSKKNPWRKLRPLVERQTTLRHVQRCYHYPPPAPHSNHRRKSNSAVHIRAPVLWITCIRWQDFAMGAATNVSLGSKWNDTKQWRLMAKQMIQLVNEIGKQTTTKKINKQTEINNKYEAKFVSSFVRSWWKKVFCLPLLCPDYRHACVWQSLTVTS